MKKIKTTIRVIGSIGIALLISLAIKMWFILLIALIIYVASSDEDYD